MDTAILISQAQANIAAGHSIHQIAQDIVRQTPDIHAVELIEVLKSTGASQAVVGAISFSLDSVDPIVDDATFYARLVMVALPQTSASELAAALKDPQNYPQLTALQMGQVLKADGVFPQITGEQMQATLTTVNYQPADVTAAVNELFPHRDPQSYTFEVTAAAQWQPTPATVRADEVATITYLSGNWQISPASGSLNADGSNYYTAKPGYMLPGAKEGMLVGLLDRTVFPIGGHGTTPANKTGVLYLATNDDEVPMYGSGYADNRGSITVRIDVTIRA